MNLRKQYCRLKGSDTSNGLSACSDYKEWKNSTILQCLVKEIKEQNNFVEEVTLESNFISDLGMDSLDTLMLILFVEDTFEIYIPDTEWKDKKDYTLGNLVNYISEQVEIRYDTIDS